LTIAEVVIALLVGKRRPSDRIDRDDSEADNGNVETMTTFNVNENYVPRKVSLVRASLMRSVVMSATSPTKADEESRKDLSTRAVNYVHKSHRNDKFIWSGPNGVFGFTEQPRVAPAVGGLHVVKSNSSHCVIELSESSDGRKTSAEEKGYDPGLERVASCHTRTHLP
jgi:hypothetical protein